MTGVILTVSEAADALGRSRGFVLALVADGLVAGRKVRGRWYVSRVSLEAWIADGANPAVLGRVVTPPMLWRGDAA